MKWIVVLLGAAALAFSQPAPFSQLDPKPYDPKVDVDMTLFMADWRDSAPRHEHGSLIVRDIFTKQEGDLLKPARRGAVLTQFTEYAHGSLYEGNQTQPTTLKGEQKVFYIYSGQGTVTAGGKTAPLRDGVGAFVPAGLEFSIKNTGSEPLNMYVIAEPVPDGFVPRKDMLVRDEAVLPMMRPTHWVNFNKALFNKEDGFAVLSGMMPSWLEPVTIAQPHASSPLGCDVLWVAISGDIYSLLGKRLFKLNPGMAFKNPGDGKAYHSNVNTSDKPIKLLWTRAVSPRPADKK